MVANHFSTQAVLLLSTGLAALWLGIMTSLGRFTYSSTLIFTWKNTGNAKKMTELLSSMEGITDFALAQHEQLVYIKADKKIIDENKLRNAIENANLNVSY